MPVGPCLRHLNRLSSRRGVVGRTRRGIRPTGASKPYVGGAKRRRVGPASSPGCCRSRRRRGEPTRAALRPFASFRPEAGGEVPLKTLKRVRRALIPGIEGARPGFLVAMLAPLAPFSPRKRRGKGPSKPQRVACKDPRWLLRVFGLTPARCSATELFLPRSCRARATGGQVRRTVCVHRRHHEQVGRAAKRVMVKVNDFSSVPRSFRPASLCVDPRPGRSR